MPYYGDFVLTADYSWRLLLLSQLLILFAPNANLLPKLHGGLKVGGATTNFPIEFMENQIEKPVEGLKETVVI